MTKIFEVVGIDDLEGEVFAHCTSKENAENAMKRMDAMEDVLEIKESLIPINSVVIDDKVIDITVNTPCILVKTVDRKTSSMGVFSDKKQAYEKMQLDMAHECGFKEIPESWKKDTEFHNEKFGSLPNTAWTIGEKYIDWTILPIEL